MARGHDVTLVPAYALTRTDELNVSRYRVLFRRHQRYLQHSRLPTHAALLDRLWDAPWLIGTFASRAVSTDARCSAS
jgi:hypothetical protein